MFWIGVLCSVLAGGMLYTSYEPLGAILFMCAVGFWIAAANEGEPPK